MCSTKLALFCGGIEWLLGKFSTPTGCLVCVVVHFIMFASRGGVPVYMGKNKKMGLAFIF